MKDSSKVRSADPPISFYYFFLSIGGPDVHIGWVFKKINNELDTFSYYNMLDTFSYFNMLDTFSYYNMLETFSYYNMLYFLVHTVSLILY